MEKRKFPVAKAKALELIIIFMLVFGVVAIPLVLEMLPRAAFQSGYRKLLWFMLALSYGTVVYVCIVFKMSVKRYWMAYRAVQAFSDSRRPVVYLRAFHADDVVEIQDEAGRNPEVQAFYLPGKIHRWLTGAPDPMVRYSLEEEIAPYFRKIGPFLSIGRPTHFVPMIGSTRVYVEDNYWQSWFSI